MLAILIAAQQPGKGTHHRRACNLAPVVKPAAIGGDLHQTVPARLRSPSFNRGQFALLHLLGNLRQRQFGKFGRGVVRH